MNKTSLAVLNAFNLVKLKSYCYTSMMGKKTGYQIPPSQYHAVEFDILEFPIDSPDFFYPNVNARINIKKTDWFWGGEALAELEYDSY